MHVLKHIVERSTHLCAFVTPQASCGYCHPTTSYFSLFTRRQRMFGCIVIVTRHIAIVTYSHPSSIYIIFFI